MRRSPPWGAMEAFITAAQVGSFKEAASELGLSPAAFSRRIQALENHLKLQLFDRRGPLPVLTPAGEDCLWRLKPGFDAVRAAIDGMAANSVEQSLRLGVSQSFAMCWLLPRLSRFFRMVDDIRVMLVTGRTQLADLKGGGVDLCIHFGIGDFTNLVNIELIEVQMTAVSAARLIDGHAAPRSLPELNSHRLLELATPPIQWSRWLASAGYTAPVPDDRIQFDNMMLMYESAAQGLGVALAAYPLVLPFMESGRLQEVFDLRVPAGSYYLSVLPEVYRQRSVRRLVQWLTTEAACSQPIEPAPAAP